VRPAPGKSSQPGTQEDPSRYGPKSQLTIACSAAAPSNRSTNGTKRIRTRHVAKSIIRIMQIRLSLSPPFALPSSPQRRRTVDAPIRRLKWTLRRRPRVVFPRTIKALVENIARETSVSSNRPSYCGKETQFCSARRMRISGTVVNSSLERSEESCPVLARRNRCAAEVSLPTLQQAKYPHPEVKGHIDLKAPAKALAEKIARLCDAIVLLSRTNTRNWTRIGQARVR